MKRIVIIGATGMLGSALYGVLGDKYEITATYRDARKLALLNRSYPGAAASRFVFFDLISLHRAYLRKEADKALMQLVQAIGKADMVINCAGIIRPKPGPDQSLTYFINGALPHILSSQYGKKLIHISTDCVFNGKSGAPYDELSRPAPSDIYGLSKLMGEPSRSSLVIRTSLIGFELGGDVSLLGWMSSQPRRKNIPGYTDHVWNGVTTRQCALVCDAIISKKIYVPSEGLIHLYSKPVTKYELLVMAAKRWRPDITVTPEVSNNSIDRRLTSVFDYCKKLRIPDPERMISELDQSPSDAS